MKIGDRVKIIDCQKRSHNERLDLMKNYIGDITYITDKSVDGFWVLKGNDFRWLSKWLILNWDLPDLPDFISEDEMML